MMKHLINYAYHHASAYKTKKSIFNIIIGKKSHQTFFDAVSLNLLSLYGCAPKLKMKTFEEIIKEEPVTTDLKITNQVTFPCLQASFNAIQLLIQTYSYARHNQMTFQPISSQTEVHHVVKQIYQSDQTENILSQLEHELRTLYQKLEAQREKICSHYLLTGFDEPMYTFTQISMIESIESDDLFKMFYEELVQIYIMINESNDFPILSQCALRLDVSQPVHRTAQLLNKGYTLQKIAQIEGVRENTIEDHILDLFMKNQMHNYQDFLHHFNQEFINQYNAEPYQRLKRYKERFDNMSYFEIKLAIVGIAKGELDA